MQGMMIQNFQPVSETKGGAAPTGSKDLSDQPFGNVLTKEVDKTGTVDDRSQVATRGRTKTRKEEKPVVSNEEKSGDQAEETKSESDAETVAAPFFMASLLDQSATFVNPSENSERVAAAEEVQNQIGQWLQNLQADQPTVTPLGSGEEDSADVEDVLTAALAIFDQLTATKPEDKSEVEPVQTDLSVDEITELKQLMAVMMQTGKVPETLQDQPLATELQQQLNKVQDLVAATAPSGFKRHTTQSSAVTPSVLQAPAAAESLVTEPVDGESGESLQEGQIAKILNPRTEQPSLHEQKGTKPGAEPVPSVAVPGVEAEVQDAPEKNLKSEVAKLNVQATTNNHQQPQQAVQAVQTHHSRDALVEASAPKMMQLPSGQQLAESQLVDQVVTHLAGSVDGESGRMRLRLHPAELGSLRLDLMVEGDRVRAHLQAQTHQVQQVLDRYLPQLRDALQQQGLKIDEFRVDVQSQADQGQPGQESSAWQQPQHQNSSQPPWQADEWQQGLEIPLEQLLEQASGGISLRV